MNDLVQLIIIPAGLAVDFLLLGLLSPFCLRLLDRQEFDVDDEELLVRFAVLEHISKRVRSG
jgi:hypothetical protein